PEAISASVIDEGPTSGTTRKPSRCAASTSAAPGSAIAGQPASERRPSARPSRSGCRNVSGLSPISWMRISRNATGILTPERKARALFAFSTAKSLSPCTVCRTEDGKTSCAAPPSGVGMAYRIKRRSSNDRQAGALEQLAQRDERQPDERARIVGLDALDERDAEPFGLGTRRAVVGLLAPQVRLDAALVQAAEHYAAG